jgi:hypothetical protein
VLAERLWGVNGGSTSPARLNLCSGKPFVATGVDVSSFPDKLYITFFKGLTLPKWVERGFSKRLEYRMENCWSKWIGLGDAGIGVRVFRVL